MVSVPELARHVSLLLTVAVTEVKTAGQVQAAAERTDIQSGQPASLVCVHIVSNNNNNNNLFYIAPQQQLYELFVLYRSTNATEHTSICYLN